MTLQCGIFQCSQACYNQVYNQHQRSSSYCSAVQFSANWCSLLQCGIRSKLRLENVYISVFALNRLVLVTVRNSDKFLPNSRLTSSCNLQNCQEYSKHYSQRFRWNSQNCLFRFSICRPFSYTKDSNRYPIFKSVSSNGTLPRITLPSQCYVSGCQVHEFWQLAQLYLEQTINPKMKHKLRNNKTCKSKTLAIFAGLKNLWCGSNISEIR